MRLLRTFKTPLFGEIQGLEDWSEQKYVFFCIVIILFVLSYYVKTKFVYTKKLYKNLFQKRSGRSLRGPRACAPVSE